MHFIPVALTNKQELCIDTYELTFSLPETCEYACSPGQYIWLILGQLNVVDTKGNRRAFSFSSVTPKEKTFSIIFRRGSSEYKKHLLSLPLGAALHITPPVGENFVVRDIPDKHIVFIAGGVGITPFLSFLRSGKQTQSASKKLIFINHNHDRAFLLEEIDTLSKQQSIEFTPHFGSFESTLIDQEKIEKSFFYISGSHSFVQKVYKDLASLGVQPEALFFEQYYPQHTTKMQAYFNKLTVHQSAIVSNPFKMLVENTSSHLVATDENGFIVYANQAAQTMTGFTFQEMVGNTPRLWGGLMNHDFYTKMWNTIKIDKKPFFGEIKNRKKNGQIYFALGRITPILDEDQVIGFIASEEEITERVTLENEVLQQKEQLLKAKKISDAMLDSIGEGVIAHDQNAKVIEINPTALQLFGMKHADFIGKSFTEVIQAETEQGEPISQENRPLKLVSRTNRPQTDTLVYVRKDNSRFTAMVANSPILVDGTTMGVIQTIRDITKEKKIDEMKTEFISLASHQLRTPLSTINWYLEMVLNGDAGPINSEQEKFVKEAYQGSSRMVALVNALLNVARIESGTFIVDPTETNIVQLVRSVLDELKPQTDEKKQHIMFEKDDLPLMMLDYQLTRIILQNLLTNAVKYTPENGTVTVELRQLSKDTKIRDNLVLDQDSFLIKVSDTGIGIPTNDQSLIFKKLFRASNVVKLDTEGTGLGLYIIKSIVEQSKGYLWFESQEQVGTQFYVVLPLSGMIKKEGSRKIEHLEH